ncbi:MAG TPA: DUF1232 domain-containing protein [Deltaproteobacteria bacterium]|nr:DUF1232 domain-containing protein [Deltaproteobacteria bacterium]
MGSSESGKRARDDRFSGKLEAMKISFELSDKDLRYFRQVLKKVKTGKSADNESLILREAEKLLEDVKQTDAPQFVQERIAKLTKLIEMVEDEDWRLEGADRKRVLTALAYFSDPDDLIHDKIPGLGYLDDAIMVELVVQDLKHEIEAYDAFVEYRKAHRKAKSASPDALKKRRASLQGRMRRRRRADRERHARTRGRSPISLW